MTPGSLNNTMFLVTSNPVGEGKETFVLFGKPLLIPISNAAILNHSFSLTLSKFLLIITTPNMTVRYAWVNK